MVVCVHGVVCKGVLACVYGCVSVGVSVSVCNCMFVVCVSVCLYCKYMRTRVSVCECKCV